MAFGVVVVRLVEVQAVGGQEYTTFGASQRFQDIALPADRGSIFDRNGNDLAVSIPQRTIWADPRLIEEPDRGRGEARPDPRSRCGRLPVAGHEARQRRQVHLRGATGRPTRSPTPWRPSTCPASSSSTSRSASRPPATSARSVLGQVGVDNEGLSGLELQYDDAPHRRPGRAHHREGPRWPHHPGGRAPARAGRPRRRPRAHDRPLDAVRDGAGAGRPDPRQGRQERDCDRVEARNRRDPRPGQPRDGPRDRPGHRHPQQHGGDRRVRAGVRQQGDHRGRRPRGGPRLAVDRARWCPIASR